MDVEVEQVKQTARPGTLKALFLQMRPKQWTKNLLVFAALIFSLGITHGSLVVQALVAFVIFCLVSSSVYILNDFLDREADKLHPAKQHRPMASGALNPGLGLAFGLVILLISTSAAFYINTRFGAVISIYFLLNVAYSLWLKHVVILDIMIIAAGFVLRAVGGGFAIEVYLTSWFLLCTMLLALFLAISKRRYELTLLESGSGEHRKVLANYSTQLIDQMIGIVAAAAIMSYALFTIQSERTDYLMLTVPVVIYGIFRYLYLIHIRGKGGEPDKVLLEDAHIQLTLLLYVVLTVFILKYLGN